MQRLPHRARAQPRSVGFAQKRISFFPGICQYGAQPVVRHTVLRFHNKFPRCFPEQLFIGNRSFTFNSQKRIELFQLGTPKSGIQIRQTKIPCYGIMTIFPGMRNFRRCCKVFGPDTQLLVISQNCTSPPVVTILFPLKDKAPSSPNVPQWRFL